MSIRDIGRAPSGFTMVEILVVLCLVGIACIPIFGLFISGSSGTTEVTNTAIALNLASETMEILSSLPYDELKTNYATHMVSTTEMFGTRFEVAVVPPQDVAGYDNYLAKVAVTVTWKEKDKDKEVVLHTLVGNQRI